MSFFDRADSVVDRIRDLARSLELGIESLQLGARGQLTFQQEVRGLLEVRVLSEVVYGVAAVAKLARAAVDEGGGRAVEINALQTPLNLHFLVLVTHFCVTSSTSVLKPLANCRMHPSLCGNRQPSASSRGRLGSIVAGFPCARLHRGKPPSAPGAD